MDEQTSPGVIGPTSFSFVGVNWGKVAAGAGVAVAGALLTYLTAFVPTLDFGPQWTPIIMAFWTVVANIARKYISQNE